MQHLQWKLRLAAAARSQLAAAPSARLRLAAAAAATLTRFHLEAAGPSAHNELRARWPCLLGGGHSSDSCEGSVACLAREGLAH
eukprot:818333-Pleurochrysis_carterae.AAC.1